MTPATAPRSVPSWLTSPPYFDRLGHDEVAATMGGFADIPYTRSVVPEISTAIAHLREVLGDQTYESLARRGER